MEQHVEISRPRASVGELRRLHVLIVDVLGQAVIMRRLAVVIRRHAAGVGRREGVDVNRYEGVGLCRIGNIAAGLQLFCCGIVRSIYVDVGRAGHDDLRASIIQQIGDLLGNRQGDILFLRDLADCADIGTAVARIDADDLIL